MELGLTSITVQSKVSTNWEMWRSLSLISAGSSSNAVLYNSVVREAAVENKRAAKNELIKSRCACPGHCKQDKSNQFYRMFGREHPDS